MNLRGEHGSPRLPPDSVDSQHRQLGFVPLSHEQPTTRAKAELRDVSPEDPGQNRRAGYPADFTDRPLLQLATITIDARIGPVLPRVRLGSLQQEPGAGSSPCA
jgi:hypothetical protein